METGIWDEFAVVIIIAAVVCVFVPAAEAVDVPFPPLPLPGAPPPVPGLCDCDGR